MFIRTGGTEEPDAPLCTSSKAQGIHSLFPLGWAEPPLLAFLKFPGFIGVLSASVVVLPQIPFSFWLLQEKMLCKTISRILLPRAKSCPWFSSENLVVSELAAGIYVS